MKLTDQEELVLYEECDKAEMQYIMPSINPKLVRIALQDLEMAKNALREVRRSLTHSYHIEGTWREVEVHDKDCAVCIIDKVLLEH